jgi:lycopene beta-cyclase
LETRRAHADCDIIFAGGGLASALCAYRLRLARSELRIVVIEDGETVGGNHTWSFHGSDLTPEQMAWIAPLIAYGWSSQAVRFPQFSRALPFAYHSVTSGSLHLALTTALGGGIMLGTRIAGIAENEVHIADGQAVRAPCIIDGRGYAPSPALTLGFQKFLGQEVRCAGSHGERAPVIMDAAISQDDGYRFVYTLPLGPDRLLIEDTYYADRAELDADLLRGKIARYAAERGWHIAEVVREEHGVLPVVLAGDIDAFWADILPHAAPIGLRAALFHPTTGYSLPDAVRLADALAGLPELTTAAVRPFVEAHSKRLWRERGFYRMLNRLLFLAAKPDERRMVMQRFYRLPEGLISRFYAASSTSADKARILIGRPPVSIGRALAALPAASARPG